MVGSLELIKKTTVSSITTSVSITDVFSDKYEVYKVTASKVLQPASSSASSLHLRLINSSGGIESTSGDYDSAFLQLRAYGSFFEGRSTTDTYMNIMLGQVDDDVYSNGAVMYVFNPYDSSSYTFAQAQSATVIGGDFRGHKSIGVFTQAKSITGLNIHLSSTGIDTGIFSVYGVK
tara:strand:+ start:28 stop:555 length:528 start_codon:yes stop_codon:yes gene_type:complete